MNSLKQPVYTTDAPAPGGPYTPAIVADKFVFISGQGPMDPQTRAIVGDTIEEQTRQTIQNVEALLKAAGSSLENIVKCNIYLADNKYFKPMNAVYLEMIPEPRPARTAVGCELRGILMEMEVIALKDDEK